MLAPQITPCTLTIRTLPPTKPLLLYYQALSTDPQTPSFQCPKWTVEACWAHNPEVGRSELPSATTVR